MELEVDWKPWCFHPECPCKSCDGLKGFALNPRIQQK